MFEFGLPEVGQGEIVGIEPVEECLGCAPGGAESVRILALSHFRW